MDEAPEIQEPGKQRSDRQKSHHNDRTLELSKNMLNDDEWNYLSDKTFAIILVRTDFKEKVHIEHDKEFRYIVTPAQHMLLDKNNTLDKCKKSGYLSAFLYADKIPSSDNPLNTSRIEQSIRSYPGEYVHFIILKGEDLADKDIHFLNQDTIFNKPNFNNKRPQLFCTGHFNPINRPDLRVVDNEFLLGGNWSDYVLCKSVSKQEFTNFCNINKTKLPTVNELLAMLETGQDYNDKKYPFKDKTGPYKPKLEPVQAVDIKTTDLYKTTLIQIENDAQSIEHYINNNKELKPEVNQKLIELRDELIKIKEHLMKDIIDMNKLNEIREIGQQINTAFNKNINDNFDIDIDIDFMTRKQELKVEINSMLGIKKDEIKNHDAYNNLYNISKLIDNSNNDTELENLVRKAEEEFMKCYEEPSPTSQTTDMEIERQILKRQRGEAFPEEEASNGQNDKKSRPALGLPAFQNSFGGLHIQSLPLETPNKQEQVTQSL